MEAGGSSEMFVPMYQTAQSEILTIMWLNRGDIMNHALLQKRLISLVCKFKDLATLICSYTHMCYDTPSSLNHSKP